MTSPPPPVASLPSSGLALSMIQTFASIGATHFDITFKHLSGERRGFRCNRDLAEVLQSIPPLVDSTTTRQNNLIVRPRVDGAACIQLDDLDRAKAGRVAPAAFLILETSPGNYQAWVAVTDAPLGLTTRLRKGTGADLNASGATRVAGTFNFKEKYAPDFPVVQIAARARGRLASVAELDGLGVLATAEKPLEIVTPAARPGRATRNWPSYGECLDRAPKNDEGNPKRTSVDFTWCQIATSWGHGIEATAEKLMEQSGKAQENGEAYAIKTAQRAAWAAQQRNARLRQP
jgi:hypothetical protein